MQLFKIITDLLGSRRARISMPDNKQDNTDHAARDFISQYTITPLESLCKAPDNAEFLVMRGIALGDIFGSPYEGSGLYKEDPMTINPFMRKSSNTTDDTVMSIAICEATRNCREHPDWDDDRIVEEYAVSMRKWAKLFPNKGYGSMFYNWAVWDMENEKYRSYGNGSAMRSGVIGAMFSDYSDVVRYAVLSAMPTHSHPEGIKGAVVTATSVWMALHGYTKDQILDRALLYYPNGFTDKWLTEDYMSPKITTEQIQALGYDAMSTICQISVPEAISNFMCSNSYNECLRKALFYKSDSDTLGAISGGIAAAYYKNTDIANVDVIKELDERLVEDEAILRPYLLGDLDCYN